MSFAPAHSAVVVRSLASVTPEDRERILQDVDYNVFAFPAGLITCDFLSDSGTSAMTDVQWAALMRGDESYGRNWGYYCLLDTFRDIFERGPTQEHAFQQVLAGSADIDFYRTTLLVSSEGGFVNGGSHQLERPNFFIVPQGRCAENLLFSTLSRIRVDREKNKIPSQSIVISNGFFDTTAANASVAGFELQVFTQPGLSDPFPQELIGKSNPFKGNLDVTAAESFIAKNPAEIALILVTITNNWAAAQPVSMANIRAAAALAQRKEIPLFFDACRFAENAYFIQRFEAGYSEKSITSIVQEMFSYVDGFTISLKKDGLANIGGVLCFRDRGLFAEKYEGIGLLLKEQQIISYGNDSYGGMSGRDLMAATAGLFEIVKEAYLHNRVTQVEMFAQQLQASGIAVLSPPGGHAVFLDMDVFFRGCRRNPEDYASVGFTLELIRAYGIRAAESGPFGWEWDKKSPEERIKIQNLVRFALPRHIMSDQHINYTIAAIKKLHDQRHTIPNVVITRGKNMRLRHFSCGLKPAPVASNIKLTYLEEATYQLSQLSEAIEQDPVDMKQILSAMALTTGRWGQLPIPREADLSGQVWISGVSKDHSPFEYSLAIAQSTGKTELRFLVEAQPVKNNQACAAIEALALNEAIEKEYGAKVSFTRFNKLRDLFIPNHFDGKPRLVAWHSCAMMETGPEWKIYLNPQVSGIEKAKGVTREAFKRLNLIDAWWLLESTMPSIDSILYFSLDLSPCEGEARVKVYILHTGATAAEIAAKHSTICPSSDSYEIQRFLRTMSGGPRGHYQGKAVISCFAFTSRSPESPVGTVHFPVDAYVSSDEEAKRRIEQYYNDSGSDVSSVCKEKYRKALCAVQRRTLAQGSGLHAWVSLKTKPGGALVNTFYFSPELFWYGVDH